MRNSEEDIEVFLSEKLISYKFLFCLWCINFNSRPQVSFKRKYISGKITPPHFRKYPPPSPDIKCFGRGEIFRCKGLIAKLRQKIIVGKRKSFWVNSINKKEKNLSASDQLFIFSLSSIISPLILDNIYPYSIKKNHSRKKEKFLTKKQTRISYSFCSEEG